MAYSRATTSQSSVHTDSVDIASLKETIEPSSTTTLIAVVSHMPTSGWKRHRTSGGIDTIRTNFMLVDPTGFVKAVAYGEKFERVIKEGRTIALQKFIYQDGWIKVINQTTVYRHAPISVPKDLLDTSKTSYSLPVSPIKNIQQVKNSPSKCRVSFTGHIMKDSAIKKVRSKTGQTLVRNLEIEDNTGLIHVALWQEAVNIEVSEGHKVTIKDALLSYNDMKQVRAITINDPEEIQVDAHQLDHEQQQITISGISDDPEILTVITDNHKAFKVTSSIFLQSLGLATMDNIYDILPIEVKCTIKYGRIMSIRKLQSAQGAVDATPMETPTETPTKETSLQFKEHDA